MAIDDDDILADIFVLEVDVLFSEVLDEFSLLWDADVGSTLFVAFVAECI